MPFGWSVAAGLSAALLAQQPQPVPDEPVAVEGVTVVAPPKEQLPDFIDALTVPGREGRFEGQIARWSKPVCPGVLGASPKVSAYFVRRISETGRAAGAKIAPSGCRPNLIVAVTSEGDRLAEELARRHRFRLFGPGRHQELAAFRRGASPVRWWSLSELGTADGNTAPQGTPVKNATSVPFVRDKGTRLQANTRENIKAVLVVVDAERTRGVSARALSAYVAMVGLARLPQEPEHGAAPTILRVFSAVPAGSRAPQDLTEHDRAYLASLYAIRPDLTYGRQRRELEQRMRRELVADEAG